VAQSARDPDEAVEVAATLLRNGTVVAKILSPDIVHKSEVGGVRLNLTSEKAVREAVSGILARGRAMMPHARIEGVTIHPMTLQPKARELIAGIADDPTFGPIIVFGLGGTAVELINDKALALPPLDLQLARDLMARTRVSRMLKAAFVARLTQIDYARAMAFIAIEEASGEMLGVVRLHADANHESGEFAVLVRSDLKGHGLGWMLMQSIIEYARVEGIRTVGGQVLRENTMMIAMCRELGFLIKTDLNESDVCTVTLDLAP
jgi:GNAT superfamily N-acetyltransferase